MKEWEYEFVRIMLWVCFCMWVSEYVKVWISNSLIEYESGVCESVWKCVNVCVCYWERILVRIGERKSVWVIKNLRILSGYFSEESGSHICNTFLIDNALVNTALATIGNSMSIRNDSSATTVVTEGVCEFNSSCVSEHWLVDVWVTKQIRKAS